MDAIAIEVQTRTFCTRYLEREFGEKWDKYNHKLLDKKKRYLQK